MLIETIVRITLGIRDHRVISAKMEEGILRVQLGVKKRRNLPCGNCAMRCRPKDRTSPRRWRHLSIWGIPVFLIYTPHRVNCSKCGIRVEQIPWSMGKSPFSVPLVVVLSFWARILAWDQVAKLFDVSYDTVKRAVAIAVEYGRSHETYQGVRHIGIDEISRKKGHTYHTVVYDLDRRRLLWSGADRSKDSLIRFFEWWGPQKNRSH